MDIGLLLTTPDLPVPDPGGPAGRGDPTDLEFARIALLSGSARGYRSTGA